MRSFVTVLVLLLGLSGAAAHAGISVDTVRDDLAAAHYDRLEAVFAEAHREALEARDFAPLREVYTVLFVTANRERFAQLEEWQAAHPASPYAATALAWSHYYRAYQWRGTALAYRVAPEANEAFAAELELAMVQARRALDEAADFLPAIEAALVLARHGGSGEDVNALVDRALEIAPDRHVLEVGLSALNLRWGGEFEDNLALCAEMADKVPRYDSELCLIEMVFESDVKGPFRAAALEALDGRDEAFLDSARFDAYLNEWYGRDGAAEEARRIHRESLGPEMAVKSFENDLMNVEIMYPSLDYRSEAVAALQAELRARLPDNPQSVGILGSLLEDGLKRLEKDPASVDLDELDALWRDLLEFGRYQAETWEIGQKLDEARQGTLGVARRSGYLVNRIHYSNYDPEPLVFHLAKLYQDFRFATGDIDAPAAAERDPDALRDAVRCPMMRAARLVVAVCAYAPNELACQPVFGTADLLEAIGPLVRDATDCTWEREAPIEELVYTPVPVEAFLTAE